MRRDQGYVLVALTALASSAPPGLLGGSLDRRRRRRRCPDCPSRPWRRSTPRAASPATAAWRAATTTRLGRIRAAAAAATARCGGGAPLGPRRHRLHGHLDGGLRRPASTLGRRSAASPKPPTTCPTASRSRAAVAAAAAADAGRVQRQAAAGPAAAAASACACCSCSCAAAAAAAAAAASCASRAPPAAPCPPHPAGRRSPANPPRRPRPPPPHVRLARRRRLARPPSPCPSRPPHPRPTLRPGPLSRSSCCRRCRRMPVRPTRRRLPSRAQHAAARPATSRVGGSALAGCVFRRTGQVIQQHQYIDTPFGFVLYPIGAPQKFGLKSHIYQLKLLDSVIACQQHMRRWLVRDGAGRRGMATRGAPPPPRPPPSAHFDLRRRGLRRLFRKLCLGPGRLSARFEFAAIALDDVGLTWRVSASRITPSTPATTDLILSGSSSERRPMGDATYKRLMGTQPDRVLWVLRLPQRRTC